MTTDVDRPLAAELERAVCEAGDTMRMPGCWTEAWKAMRDLARKVAAITREQDAKVLEGFIPETTIFPATRKIVLAAAAAIREQATHD